MKYFAITILFKGKKTNYGVYANTKKEAHQLSKNKYKGIVLKVNESSPPVEDQVKHLANFIVDSFTKKRLNHDALIGAVRQLAVMTNAGIAVHDAIEEIANSSEDKKLKTIFHKLADDIDSGFSLTHAMNAYRFELGNLVIAMVELGEKTGNLAESLYTLADMLEEIRKNITKFKKAMAYPRNVMIAMAIAFVILISYVVPQFKEIFSQLHASLPLPTRILLFLEELFNNYGPAVIAVVFITFFLLRYLINSHQEIKYRYHQFLLKIYLIKNIIKFATLNRFTLVFSELVAAGIPITEALDTATSMIDNLVLRQKLTTIKVSVEKGSTLSDALGETKLFENMIAQMISAGENSGQLDSMLKKVTEYYKMRFDAIIDGLSSAIEPILLFFMAGMIILLALGIFLPMWDLGNAVQGRL